MSDQQDRFTFFGVLVAVVIVVLGYLQLSQRYPIAGSDRHPTPGLSADADEPGSGEMRSEAESLP